MDVLEAKINKRIPIPLYYQLKELLREHIRNNEVGDPIPTEQQLCQHFGISRPTVRQAISGLVAEGYLQRSKGKGTFIAQPKINQDFLQVLESFNREMRDKGLTPATRVLAKETTVVDEDNISMHLKLPRGASVIYLRRLRFVNNSPLVLVNTFLPLDRLPNLNGHDLERESLYELIEHEHGLSIARAERTLEAVVGEEEDAQLLQIDPGSAVQYIETVTYLTDGSPIEFSQAWYRGDMARFTFELTKKRV
ncbi:MAG: GntR family transcriptional regulator [Spirochaetaceae bacterium]|nr:MAG: GntR family transcriptional regulator [Spirochaetaceae bacterium]